MRNNRKISVPTLQLNALQGSFTTRHKPQRSQDIPYSISNASSLQSPRSLIALPIIQIGSGISQTPRQQSNMIHAKPKIKGLNSCRSNKPSIFSLNSTQRQKSIRRIPYKESLPSINQSQQDFTVDAGSNTARFSQKDDASVGIPQLKRRLVSLQIQKQPHKQTQETNDQVGTQCGISNLDTGTDLKSDDSGLQSRTSMQLSPTKLQPTAPRRESDSIRSKQESVSSMQTSEDHSVWDNRELMYRGVDVHHLDEKEELQQFLKLFKMRFGGFPGQQESIANEEVIKVAITYAKVNKRMFRKYFPQNTVIFEDEVDYSKEHDLLNDPNFKKFLDYFKQQQDENEPEPTEDRSKLRTGERYRNEQPSLRPREKTML